MKMCEDYLFTECIPTTAKQGEFFLDQGRSMRDETTDTSGNEKFGVTTMLIFRCI